MSKHVRAERDGQRVCGWCRVRWPCLGKHLEITNRLEELRAKGGREVEDTPLPEWLDHMPEAVQPAAMAQHADGFTHPVYTTVTQTGFKDLDV